MTYPAEIRSIVILGGGTAGWMTAAAMAKVFGPRIKITLVESEEIGTVGVGEATIPAIKLFNAMLRIDEDEFVRETQGTFKLGIEFRNWRHKGHSYFHSFGDMGRDLAYIPFHHYWLADHLEGGTSSLWDYSLSALASERNRFDRRPMIPDSPLQGLTHAFQFDAGLYAAYLRRFAERLGVVRREGKVSEVTQDSESGDVQSLRLENGEMISGEFFFDCSGFRGLLIEDTLKAGYDDWRHWLPCDRALAVPCEKADPLTPYTRSTAHEAGWQWRIPLQHRTGNGHVFSSEWTTEDKARDVLMANLDGKPLADPKLLRFVTGRRKTFWKNNVVALGLAAGFLEPLESTSIHMVQSAIERIIMLFPHTGSNSVLRDEYNHITTVEYELVRDFIILHYTANEREGEPFWDYCRNMPLPDGLRHKIELFRECGVIQPTKLDLFQTASWLQVLFGQGIIPKTAHPFVQAISPADRAGYLANIREIMAHEVATLPTHAEFIASHCQAPKLQMA